SKVKRKLSMNASGLNFFCRFAGACVYLYHIVYGMQRTCGYLVKSGFDDAHDVGKSYFLIEETCYGHFVGGIKDGRRAASRFERFAANTQSGKAFRIRWEKGELAEVSKIEFL